MNAVETKSFAGMAILGVQAMLQILKAFGVKITPDMDAAVQQMAAWIVGAYLWWSGREDAINTAPPAPPNPQAGFSLPRFLPVILVVSLAACAYFTPAQVRQTQDQLASAKAFLTRAVVDVEATYTAIKASDPALAAKIDPTVAPVIATLKKAVAVYDAAASRASDATACQAEWDAARSAVTAAAGIVIPIAAKALVGAAI